MKSSEYPRKASEAKKWERVKAVRRERETWSLFASSDLAELVALHTITLDPFNPSYENSVVSWIIPQAKPFQGVKVRGPSVYNYFELTYYARTSNPPPG